MLKNSPTARTASAPLKALFAVLGGLCLWQFLGSSTQWGHHILSTPTQIINDVATHPALYGKHVGATVAISVKGFAIGALAAFLAAVIFILVPPLEMMLRGVNIAIYTMPSIVLGPLLVLFLKDSWPQTILAAMMAYFPAMSTILLGLKEIDGRYADLIEVYGGGPLSKMRFVRLRGALPQIFAGLRVAAPIAVLGAVLGEFGSGARFGLGSFLLSTLPQGNPARLWGIGIGTSAVAFTGFLIFLLPAKRTQATTAAATLPAAATQSLPGGGRWRIVFALIAAGMPIFLWWLALKLSGLSPIIAPGPWQTMTFSVSEQAGPLWEALGQTVPMAALGLLAGLTVAFALASLSVLAPGLARALMPVALVVQNTPLIAMVPFVVLVFGRGVTATTLLAAIVVFFPAYVLITQGFANVPPAARDLLRTYGGSRRQELVMVAVPWSISYFFTAARMVAPQALLGVMVAEWLISGVGLGNLMNISRGTLDYETIWAGAMISILISVTTYEFVGILERKTRR